MEWRPSFSKYLFTTLILCAQYSCAQDECIEKTAPLKKGDEIVLKRKSYIVSYNADNKIPNWVAWHLIAEHVDGRLNNMRMEIILIQGL